jgi:molybdate transport system substrate-binding protein
MNLTRTVVFLVVASSLLGACHRNSVLPVRSEVSEINVAAAANLTDSFAEVGKEFTAASGIRIVTSFGSTGDLSKQIENGAPFDVFAAADAEHVDALDRKGLLTPGTRALYARGRLVLWLPQGSPAKLTRIEDIVRPEVRTIAIAKPDLAPYGRATVESLTALNLWAQVEPRVVYGENVNQTKQYASTGNAEVAFIPLALVKPGEGRFIEVEDRLHKPIDQALGVVKASNKQDAARQFATFVLGDKGQSILARYGYRKPA